MNLMEPMPVVLAARFRDTSQTVRLLCYGRSAYDHAWLQRRSDDVEVCLAYMHEHSIPCVLVGRLDASLTAQQRQRLCGGAGAAERAAFERRAA
jgi:hypothetical protein